MDTNGPDSDTSSSPEDSQLDTLLVEKEMDEQENLPASQPPDSFPRFTELPPEIRNQIWGLISEIPQKVIVTPHPQNILPPHPSRSPFKQLYYDKEYRRKAPAMIHVNQEARTFILRKCDSIYVRSIGQWQHYRWDDDRNPPFNESIVVQFHTDEFYHPHPSFSTILNANYSIEGYNLQPDAIARIQFLSLITLFESWSRLRVLEGINLKKFRSLKRLTFLLNFNIFHDMETKFRNYWMHYGLGLTQDIREFCERKMREDFAENIDQYREPDDSPVEICFRWDSELAERMGL